MKSKSWIGWGVFFTVVVVVTSMITYQHQSKMNSRIGGGNQVKHLEVTELKEGKGAAVTIGNQVTLHYSGRRWDGVLFDSSDDRKKPMIFRVGAGSVFRGIEQGVLGMKVGGKRKLIIPPDMAAGVNGTSGNIPQNAALIYEIELIKIQ